MELTHQNEVSKVFKNIGYGTTLSGLNLLVSLLLCVLEQARPLWASDDSSGKGERIAPTSQGGCGEYTNK